MYTRDESIYSTDRLFPENPARIVRTGYMRGQRLALVEISPVRFNPVRKELEINPELEVKISPVNPRSDVIQNAGPMENIVSYAALNHTSLSGAFGISGLAGPAMSGGTGQVCWCQGSDWRSAANSAITCGADYLIIVAEELNDSSLIDSLAYKRANYNGFNVAIAKMSQIDPAPDIDDTPDTIRSFIKTIYDSQSAAHMGDGRLGYVLLIGDAYNPVDSVLIPSFYGYVDSGQTIKESLEAASDAYYSFLDNDPFEDVFPDVYIGRLPVDYDPSYWELTNVVNKITDYEPLPAGQAWVDSILMVSGDDDHLFTFDDQGLTGFSNYFDSISTYYIPPDRNVRKLHRLTYDKNDITKSDHFGNLVAATIDSGKWVTGLFDHGSYFNLSGAFYPQHYDSLRNPNRHTVLFSLASYTGSFDLRYLDRDPLCCIGPSYGDANLSCYSASVATDSCDVFSERLIVQPDGAVAVLSLSRSQHTVVGQSDFINFFRSLFEQNASTLGEVLVGTRMYQISNNLTARNLMLFGDPALNIRWQEGDQEEPVDLAIGSQDLTTTGRKDYFPAGESIELDVTVKNIWQNDAEDVLVEIWRGEPADEGSVKLDSVVLDTVRAYGDTTTTTSFTLTGLSGRVEIFAVVDPEDEISEASEDNNVASMEITVYTYEGDFPVKVPNTAHHAITFADVHPSPKKEFLIVRGFGELDCYTANDTTPLWTFSRNPDDDQTKATRNTPLVGYVYKNDTPCVVVEVGRPAYTYVLNGANGTVIDSVIQDQRDARLFNWKSQKYVLTDLVADDEKMEFVTTFHKTGFARDTLFLEARTPDDTAVFSEAIWIGTSGWDPQVSICVADIDTNGTKEIVVLRDVISFEPPASGKELDVYTFADSTLSQSWQKDVRSVNESVNASIVTTALIDRNNDGVMEILCDGNSGSNQDNLRLFSASGTDLWSGGISVADTHYFAVGDVDADSSIDIVVAETGQIRILSSADGSVKTSDSVDGYPVTSPLLVDIDNDGKLDIIALFERKDPNIYFPPQNKYCTELRILDDQLNAIDTYTFSSEYHSATKHAGLPAVGDMDGDGVYEVAYVSPDRYLHVFEIGTSAGDAAWPQRFCNPMQTNTPVQPIVGEYSNDVSLCQNVRMLGDVTLDSVSAPTLYIGPGTSVQVDKAASGDGYEFKAYGRVTINGTAADPVEFYTIPAAGDSAAWMGLYIDDQAMSAGETDSLSYLTLRDAWIGIEHHTPLDINHASISNTFGTGVYSDAALSLRNSTVTDSEGRGVFVGQDIAAKIDGSTIDYHEAIGVTCDRCTLTVSNNTVVSHNGLDGLKMYFARSGSSVSSSSFHHNDYDGIHCEYSSPAITSCTVDNNASGGIDCSYYSDPTVRYSSIKNNQVGVWGAQNSYPFLGSTGTKGHNCFEYNSSHHVVNLSSPSTPIYAEYNYWGALCCIKKLLGYIICNYCDSERQCTGPSGSAPVDGGGGDDEDVIADLPQVFDLGVGYPNPFNPVTVIPYQVPPPGARVEITVFNVLGQSVIDLVKGHQAPGYYKEKWYGVNSNGNTVASGIYFVRMKTRNFNKTTKLVLLK